MEQSKHHIIGVTGMWRAFFCQADPRPMTGALIDLEQSMIIGVRD